MIPTLSRQMLQAFCAFLAVLLWLRPGLAQEAEKTYSITLLQTAEAGKDVYKMGDKKVFAKPYTVREGEWVWKLLREKGLTEEPDFPELFSMFKKLNASIDKLDLVYPGQTILIPLKIMPLTEAEPPPPSVPEKVIPPSELKDLKFDEYRIASGDSFIKVVEGRYDVSQKELYTTYLPLAKKLNPAIKDLNIIYAGQIVRLPVYPGRRPGALAETRVTQRPAEPVEKVKEEKARVKTRPGQDLGAIFRALGEEWVQTGELFIPLKSGGQLNVKAESFPVLNLQNGLRVIVDLENRLPPEIASLIRSSWSNYRVVHLGKGSDLRSSLGKILEVCGYPKIYGTGQPFELKGTVTLRITGDFVVRRSETPEAGSPDVAVINLRGPETQATPVAVKNYLEGLGIKVIDFPRGEDKTPTAAPEVVKGIETPDSPSTLIKTLLDLVGQNFTSRQEIPVYDSQRGDLKLTIRADFFLHRNGEDIIIDLAGTPPEVLSFLKDHRFKILSLAGIKDPEMMVTQTLNLLGVPFHSGPQTFMTTRKDDLRNIRIRLPGIVFEGARHQKILATPLDLPQEMRGFLWQKGYRILTWSFS